MTPLLTEARDILALESQQTGSGPFTKADTDFRNAARTFAPRAARALLAQAEAIRVMQEALEELKRRLPDSGYAVDFALRAVAELLKEEK